jgi:hypothetical protein
MPGVSMREIQPFLTDSHTSVATSGACDVDAERDRHGNADGHSGSERRARLLAEETVRTDNSGRWTLRRTGTPASPIYTEIKADGYIDRRVQVRWDPAGRPDVSIDMIRDAAPFSLGFFRQIIRNDLEDPGNLQHTRCWTTNPNFYLNTFNPRTGHQLLQRTRRDRRR